MKQRLVDANALKEAIRNIEFHFGYSFDDAIADAVDAIESAPTVETTDDVMKRLPDWSIIQKRPDHYVATEDGGFVDLRFPDDLGFEEWINRQ